MLLNHSVTLKDMESVDVELHNTINYIQENDPEPLCLTFALNKTVFGEVSCAIEKCMHAPLFFERYVKKN